MEGKWKYFYENGQLKQDIAYYNGELNGLAIAYYESGSKSEESNWKNGVSNGAFKIYHENGNIARTGTYLNGKENGLLKSFFENGNIEMEAYFVKGTAHGAAKIYHSNGKIKIKCNVDSTSLADGNIYGDFYEYKEDGTISKHVFVEKDGTIVDKMKKNNTHTSAGTNTSHNCSWCGKNFKGPGYLYYPIFPQDDTPCTVQDAFFYILRGWCSKKCAMEECMSNK